MGLLGFRRKSNRARLGRTSALRLFSVAYKKITKANQILEENQRRIDEEVEELNRLHQENTAQIQLNDKLREQLKPFLPEENEDGR